MRKLIKNVITREEAGQLPSPSPATKNIILKGLTNPVMLKVLDIVLNETNIKFEDLSVHSFARIEDHPLGHSWHTDTGKLGENHDNPEMYWCRYGASLLLSDRFTGGDFRYKDSFAATGPITVAERQVFDLLIHDSKQIHSVLPSEGSRLVLLFFI